MKTLFSVGILLGIGALAFFLSTIVVNLAGVPGAILAGTPGKRSKGRFQFGSIVSAIGQSYIYLAYVAFVTNWTTLASKRPDVFGIVLWPFAFLVCILPIWFNMGRASAESKTETFANPQAEALPITFLASFVGFFIFAFIPSAIKFGWPWIPYI